MKSNTKQLISIVEREWELKLFNHCQDLFKASHIPSHNHLHHKRVWNYAKEILSSLSSNLDFNKDFIEALLFATYFHDTGLTINLSETHGNDSNVFFLQYLNDNNIQLALQDNISTAIKKHDDKGYKKGHPNSESLLSILTTADDLDAFGNIGVVRYIEIYAARGLSMREMPALILKNLENRYLNFLNLYSSIGKLKEQQERRYKITQIFFKRLINFDDPKIDEAYQLIIAKLINNDFSRIRELIPNYKEYPYFVELINEMDL